MSDPASHLTFGDRLSKKTLITPQKAFEDYYFWSQRWSLSLAIANGAGLAGVLVMLADPAKRDVWPLLYPSAWMLLGGVAISGLLPAVHAWAAHLTKYVLDYLELLEEGGHDDEDEARRFEFSNRLGALLDDSKLWLRIIAGALFIAAIAWPLWVRSWPLFIG